MLNSDIEFISTSKESGKAYGYPECCIDAFCKQTPGALGNKKPDANDRLRYAMGHVNGKFSGFVPCLHHARQIMLGKIKLQDLIKNRTVRMPFPFDWSMRLIAFLFLSSVFFSCGPPQPGEPERPIPTKPFYVIDKWTYKENESIVMAGYVLIDKNGHRFRITDKVDKYSFGDSIK